MYPFFKKNDVLIVEYFDNNKTLDEFTAGDILLHRDKKELMVHRLLPNNRIKGDWGGGLWEGPVLGLVHGLERDKRYFMWGPEGHKFKRFFSLVSEHTTSQIKTVRISAKILLIFITKISLLCHFKKNLKLFV